MTDRPAEVVYLIGSQASGHAKIGRAGNADKRLRDIQTTSPLKLEIFWTHPGGAKLESAFHRHFATRRMNGEWFDFGSARAAKELVSAALPEVLREMEERSRLLAALKAEREAERARQRDAACRQSTTWVESASQPLSQCAACGRDALSGPAGAREPVSRNASVRNRLPGSSCCRSGWSSLPAC